MTERKKDLLFLSLLLAVLLLCFSRILFTHQIIRAPDIIAEFYWGVKGFSTMKFWDLFKISLVADWNMFINSGLTVEGGSASSQFLLLRNIIFWLFPAPANVAWFIVFHLFFGAAGTYCCCRLIGAGRLASLLGGLIFALATENASLINAGHVMKIATISFAPWVFYFLEKGFKTRRAFYFLTTAVVLAFQFFHTHWQIAYYTCLAVGVYGVARSIGILREESGAKKEFARLLGLNLTLLAFFLTTVAISLVPLANWSKDTNRGVNSGANAVASDGAAPKAKGGLAREEAMSWSLPPEETVAFVIPGFFGLSRQEGGENPTNIASYYWGRMHFTQTASYMGLLPWLLLPLPLIFRRDRYTWLALAAVVVGILFSMGKYTPFYNLLFDFFPGINRFRVPKMIMFIPVLGLGVLSARGLDLLLEPELRRTREFKRYLAGLILLPVSLLVLLGAETFGKEYWMERFIDMLAQPTRYEASSEQLVLQRWGNLVTETAIAAGLSALFAAAYLLYYRGLLTAKLLIYLLFALFLADVGRVNSKFMFLVNEPQQSKGVKTPEIAFLSDKPKEYRVLPMNGSDPMQFASAGIPVMFTSNPVQQRRWQEMLDNFNLGSSATDILNVRYLVYAKDQFEQDKANLSGKYAPVFTSPDGATVILENRNVLPKAWLAPIALPVSSAQEALGALQDPAFNPRLMALVESVPPIQMAGLNTPLPGPAGEVRLLRYEGERIDLEASVAMNSMLVLGEKYYKGWSATVDGKEAEIYPVNHVLRGIYLTPGNHKVAFVFDPTPFKIGKYLTLASFALFALMLVRELRLRRKALKA
ncbi:MAG: hypothetical protein A2075_04205 [Geobacteraceae bacterium GWC2_58_44]|nr:MAG: hypothetical protein A2075_04205 [Geobacteraceae bacterium GWC2_58_44]HBG06074.1 hypothetical protein [Geobacter sp.]